MGDWARLAPVVEGRKTRDDRLSIPLGLYRGLKSVSGRGYRRSEGQALTYVLSALCLLTLAAELRCLMVALDRRHLQDVDLDRLVNVVGGRGTKGKAVVAPIESWWASPSTSPGRRGATLANGRHTALYCHETNRPNRREHVQMDGAGRRFSLRVLIPAVAAGPRAAVTVGGEGAQSAVIEEFR